MQPWYWKITSRLNMKTVSIPSMWALPQMPGDVECSGVGAWCYICAEYWRRIRLEFTIEWPLLKQKWKVILFGLIMQYVHGIFTQLAHRMHRPATLLRDVGFMLTPEMGANKHWVSEILFFTGLICFILWTFSPFISQRKRFYTAVLWSRLLMILVVCQGLRIITFSVTSLPGPAHHCRLGQESATRDWPKHWWGHLVVDVKRQATKSCGDLIFSSHTTFFLTGILAYHMYGVLRWVKVAAWALGAVLSTLIIASRKHYTVDVVVAWYTVPLVFHFMHRRWTTKRPLNDDADDGSVSDTFDLGRDEFELEEVVVTLNPANSETKPLLPPSSNRTTGPKPSHTAKSERDTSNSADTTHQKDGSVHAAAERGATRSVGHSRSRSHAGIIGESDRETNMLTFAMDHRHQHHDMDKPPTVTKVSFA